MPRHLAVDPKALWSGRLHGAAFGGSFKGLGLLGALGVWGFRGLGFRGLGFRGLGFRGLGV